MAGFSIGPLLGPDRPPSIWQRLRARGPMKNTLDAIWWSGFSCGAMAAGMATMALLVLVR